MPTVSNNSTVKKGHAHRDSCVTLINCVQYNTPLVVCVCAHVYVSVTSPYWTLPSAAHTSSRHHLLWRGCDICVSVCVCISMCDKNRLYKCVCVTRGGGISFSLSHTDGRTVSLSSIPPFSQGAFSTSSLFFFLCKDLLMNPVSSVLIANYIQVVLLLQSRQKHCIT